MAGRRFSTSISDAASLVKQSVDIVDVVSQAVSLRRVGNRYVGLCPFHQEKTPSFQVDAEHQLFYCFGCGNGGDVLSFVMRYQNLSFGEALDVLAERYNIHLPQQDSSGKVHEPKQKLHELYHVLDIASNYFYDQLHHTPNGEVARRYIQQRALKERVVEEQRIGYAPDRWDGLLKHLEQSGIDPQMGVQAGLLLLSKGERYYDRFRHRLIFPIVNDRSKVVAFGGRSLDGSDPKYLNSPETPIYHKGRMLYNLARAREACRELRQVVLVEGYMDLLAFHNHGFYRVAATLGTALTAQQVRLLARVCDEVIMLYDADAAGERAMLRALPLVLQEELQVTCLQMPQGMDPDDYLKSNGLEAFERLVAERQDLGKFAVAKVLDTWDGTTGGKSRVLKDLQPILDGVRQPMLMEEYLRLVADRLSLSEQSIGKQLAKQKRLAPRPPVVGAPVAAHPIISESQTRTPEENIVRVMIKFPTLIDKVKDSGILSYFQEPKLRDLAETMTQMSVVLQETAPLKTLYDSLPDPEMRQFAAGFLMERDPHEDFSAASLQLDDWLGAVQQRQVKLSRQDLLAEIQQAERAKDAKKVKDLLRQLQEFYPQKRKELN